MWIATLCGGVTPVVEPRPLALAGLVEEGADVRRLVVGLHRASTSARSLSPRPERQTTTSSASSSSTRASACAGSSAGMMPSVRGQPAERVERLVVGRADVAGPAGVAQEGVLRADAGVVEAGGDRVGVGDLAVLVGEHGGARAVEDAGPTGAEARGARRLDADELDVRVVDEAGEHADRVRAAADARDDGVRQAALGLEDLRARLAPDHRLELADDLRVRRRPDARADQVVRRLDVRDPVADRLARRLLQRPRAELDRAAPRRRGGPCARRSASGGACPRCPCRRRTRARSARRRSRSRRRAGRRRSRPRSGACRAGARAPPGRARC